MKIQGFESWLEDKFLDGGEWNEHAITKDSIESDFEQYLETLDGEVYIALADEYGEFVRDFVKMKLAPKP